MTGRTYLLLILSLCAAVLAPTIALNLALGNRSLGSPEVTRMASDWQQATRGVTYSPPIMSNGAFKTLRLHDRLPEINAIVFGASSAMGITAAMFPKEMKVYNFSQSGNGLGSSLGEARYIRAHFPDRIKWLIIPFDWSIGMVFVKGAPHEVDLSAGAAVRGTDAREVPFYSKLLDALSFPKIVNLRDVLSSVMRSAEKWKAFGRVFLEISSEEYSCPDGSRARDFDVLYRGKCGGFYYDGSSRFLAWKQIRAADVKQKVLAASMPSSKYSQSLQSTGGQPNAVFLDTVARLNRDLKRAGGKAIVILPPLIPGLEELLGTARHSAASLARLKSILSAWAEQEGIIVLDAGRSERYGCQPLEFLDEHHAMRECYQKVFDRFWRDYRRGVAPGLYAPD